MATFTATNAGADMMLLFGWVDGSTPIETLIISSGPDIADAYEDPFDGYLVRYTGTAFTKDELTPTGGTFTSAEIYVPVGAFYVLTGTLSGVTATTDNFAHIIDEQAYDILDGDDTLNGGDGVDVLFGGFDGTDI